MMAETPRSDRRWALDSNAIPADYPAGRVLMARGAYRALHPDFRARIDGEPAAMVRDDRPRAEWPHGPGGTMLVIVELV